ncbi:MAG: hypothetical protein COR54_08495 [Elusimicrobia bacterium CG22_combo_CG10-13_8_21_14_all_63_91]|nr:MAG: hypothetical protein COR54_08495 [Elusimicrobia bacterium CG22_combo_CG10-13_8_21_14_all_63_91]
MAGESPTSKACSIISQVKGSFPSRRVYSSKNEENARVNSRTPSIACGVQHSIMSMQKSTAPNPRRANSRIAPGSPARLSGCMTMKTPSSSCRRVASVSIGQRGPGSSINSRSRGR